jgi:hypothetical protein
MGAAVAIAAGREGPALFALVVVAFSINRFFLAGLSAALPHVVEPDELVLANSVTPTSGTIAFMVGIGLGTGARDLVSSDSADVVVVGLAAATYFAAALLTTRIPVRELGPDLLTTQPALGAAVSSVTASLRAGFEHLHRRPVAAHALMVIAAHRFFYGLSVVATILLYRSYFHDPTQTDAALAGLSVAVLVTGLGFFAAAVFTPLATEHLPVESWIVALLAAAALVEAFPGGLYTEPGVLFAAFFLGVSSQGVKISVDTLVQRAVEDDFRGRVFALYDVGFNVVFVAAAAVGALVIPASGKSYAVLALIAGGYAVSAALYWRAERQRAAPVSVAC